ncbi:MAG TPA: hypothetical protein VHA75_08620, partial [Rugosimonospora sp.]|nr:hypothetical protein [Rugosimonospora sp.]
MANTSASTATYTASATQPDLSITKSDNVSGSLSLPGSFTWTLVLSNAAGAGDAVFADGQVLLSDPLPSGPTYGSPAAGSFTDITNSANLSCSIVSGTLRCAANGADVTVGAAGSFAVSLVVTPASSGDLTNTATADPLDTIAESNEGNNTAGDTVTVSASGPEMTVAKLADLAAVDAAGDVIHYTITVDNTGSTSLTAVDVSDALLTDLDCDGVPGLPYVTTGFTIAAGGSLECTGTYTALQADLDDNGGGDGDIDNTVTVSSNELSDQTASETVAIAQNPDLTITKNADVSSVDAAGDVIHYTVSVANTGNLTLTGLAVSDPMVTDLAYVSGDAGTVGSLEVGETWLYNGSYTVTLADLDAGTDLVNTATADSDQTSPAADDATVTITQAPGSTFTKTADVASVDAAGDVINYTLTFTNTGNLTLTGVTISDTRLSSLSCTPSQPGSLAPGDDMLCTGSYTATQADLDAGL